MNVTPRNCIVFNVSVLLLFVVGSATGQPSSNDLLSHLEGSWTMTGTVLKKPVQYKAEGKWVLQNGFLSFHMLDTTLPSPYEANLFIGIDSAKNQYVAHWLDKYGGAGSRVVGMGPLTPDKIEIVYPYEEGRFRNQFRYNQVLDRWSLVIEAEGEDGRWSVFAEYTIQRR
jgi:hypothetical protein